MGLTVPERQRLVAICGLLGSPFEGERAAAALKACEFLAAHKLAWADVLHAEPPLPVIVPADRTWRQVAEQMLFDHTQALTAWEQGFLQDVLRRGRAPTERQAAILYCVAAKTGVPVWQ